MQQAQRVVITGIGAITPIGTGAANFWQGVVRGRSAVAPVTRFDTSALRSRLAAEVTEFRPLEHLSGREARRLDRFSQFAVVASRLAIEDAGLHPRADPILREQVGCYIGSALGGVAFAEAQHDAFLRGGIGAVSPSLALTVFAGAACSNVSMELGLRGPSVSNANSCASGAIAIGEAFRLIRSGLAPAMLAGGVEVPLAPLTFGAFALIKAMSTASHCPASASRPFDASRDGFVMGEGAGMLVLEAEGHARARGARVYAELVGYGVTSDAHNMLAPLPGGQQAARAIQLALRDAGVAPAAVDYVNAHASATPLGDRAEALAIGLALGEHASRVPVSGTKGLYGHPLGASGAMEAGLSALAIHHEFLPGTANLVTPEAENTLNLLPPEGRHAAPAIVVSNAFGFGGINAALVLARPSPT